MSIDAGVRGEENEESLSDSDEACPEGESSGTRMLGTVSMSLRRVWRRSEGAGEEERGSALAQCTSSETTSESPW